MFKRGAIVLDGLKVTMADGGALKELDNEESDIILSDGEVRRGPPALDHDVDPIELRIALDRAKTRT